MVEHSLSFSRIQPDGQKALDLSLPEMHHQCPSKRNERNQLL